MMTVVFMLFEVQLLPYKLQQALDKPNEGLAAMRRALDGVTRYLVIKTIISLATGVIVWIFLAAVGVRFAFIWGCWRFCSTIFPISARCWPPFRR